jgi:hypothetical protein
LFNHGPCQFNVLRQFIDPRSIVNVIVSRLHEIVQGLAKQINFFLIGHLSILSKLRPQVYHRASKLQQIKQKKLAGPPTPATTIQGKNPRKKNRQQRKNPRA